MGAVTIVASCIIAIVVVFLIICFVGDKKTNVPEMEVEEETE